MSVEGFPGRVGLQQRVLPAYRAPLFERLAGACEKGLSVFAGPPGPSEGIAPARELKVARWERARNLHLFNPAHPLYLCWQAGFLDWLQWWDPDVLIAEANPRYLASRSAIRWMQARGRPVLGWGLGAPQIRGLLAPLRAPGRIRFLMRFDALIAYSRRGAAEYRALGMPAERVHVATNAVAPRPAQPPSERPPTFEGRPQVLFVGRLQARKRIDLLLQACVSLPDERQPHLVVVGDGPARASLEALAAELSCRAEFVGDQRGQELESRFAGSDLFVLPGTGGLAVQEAMAHGLPVIVAEGDGTQDDLVRPGNGWLIPPGDRAALAAALREALSDPVRLRRMGRDSYRIVQEEVNLEAMVKTFIGALNGLRAKT